MRPPGLFSRCGRQRRTRRTNGCSRSSNADSSASSVSSDALPAGGPPEFQTRMSTPPNASTVFSTARSRSVALVTSPRTASAPMRFASRSSSSRRRATIVTFAPSSARASADASPRPDDAPHTIAVLPRRPRSIARTVAGVRHPGLRAQHADDVAHGVRRLREHRLLGVVEVDLEDLLDPFPAELDRDAHIEAVDAVLALEVRGAREHALL